MSKSNATLPGEEWRAVIGYEGLLPATEGVVTEWTKEKLIAFRDKVADAFKNRRISSPVHFPGGQEAQIIEAMRDFRPGVDWLCTDWRNMYRCLLAGMPEEELFQQILEGRSMYVMSAERRILCSSIVGGILPIACGLAMGIKKNKCRYCIGGNGWNYEPSRNYTKCHVCNGVGMATVWVIIGDMTATTGLYHEFINYVAGHRLPVQVVVENNRRSTNADTEQTWGTGSTLIFPVRGFCFERTMPHVGLAEKVSF